jgi:hypothetical protein
MLLLGARLAWLAETNRRQAAQIGPWSAAAGTLACNLLQGAGCSSWFCYYGSVVYFKFKIVILLALLYC